MRLQLEVPTLDGLAERVARQFGDRARVVSAEPVTTGGFFGFFARRHFDVVVVVPDAAPAPVPAGPTVTAATTADASGPSAGAPTVATGLAALLAAAEAEEGVGASGDSAGRGPSGVAGDPAGRGPSGVPGDRAADPSGPAALGPSAVAAAPAEAVSTAGAAFATVLDDLVHATAAPPTSVPTSAPVVRVPPRVRPMGGPGDLVAVVGLGDDPLTVARSLALRAGAPTPTVGGVLRHPGLLRVDTRREALAARARSVARRAPGHLAYGLGTGTTGVDEAAAVLRVIAPDQVVLAVDAARKADDTERWARRLIELVHPAAMVVLNVAATATPETVDVLGLPRIAADAVGLA